jgi:hypothetical protein
MSTRKPKPKSVAFHIFYINEWGATKRLGTWSQMDMHRTSTDDENDGLSTDHR